MTADDTDEAPIEPVDALDAVPSRFTSVHFGGGIGIVATSTLAVLEADNGLLGEELWRLIEGDVGIDDLLEAVAVTGLRSLGSFAMAQFEDDAVRVVVRGSGVGEVTFDGIVREIRADGVRTWVEELVPLCDRLVIRLGRSQPAALPFRIDRGLVPADLLLRDRSSCTAPVLSNLDIDVDSLDGLDGLDGLQPLRHAGPVTRDETPPMLTPEPHIVEMSRQDPFSSAPVLETSSDGAAAEAPNLTRSAAEFDASVDDESGAARSAHPPATDHAPHEHEFNYDSMYGHTIARSVQGAAVPEDEADLSWADRADVVAAPHDQVVNPAGPADDHRYGGESTGAHEVGIIDGVPSAEGVAPSGANPQSFHDGATMTRAQLAALRANGSVADPGPSLSPPPMGGPSVQALMCPVGHASPPQDRTCRRCGLQLAASPVIIARPVLGQLRFNTGETVRLDRPALIGRNPKLEGRMTGEMPQIVKLDVGNGLSRAHCIVRLEGWQVLVEDLDSRNGTMLTLPGRPVRRLHAGEPALLESGAVIDLGGDAYATFETTE